MPSPTDLFLSLLIGSIASAYLVYGRRQGRPLVLLCGFALLALPFLASGWLTQISLTMLLMAAPFLLPRR